MNLQERKVKYGELNREIQALRRANKGNIEWREWEEDDLGRYLELAEEQRELFSIATYWMLDGSDLINCVETICRLLLEEKEA